MRRWLTISLTVFLFWQRSGDANAQESTLLAQFWSTEHGLSHRDVQCIHQDRLGLIWLGTKYGLNRFDGSQFKWFTQEKNGLQSNEVNFILEDQNGLMWLVQTGGFLSKKVITIDIFDPFIQQVQSLGNAFGKSLPFAPNELIGFAQNDQKQLVFVTKNQLITYSDKFEAHAFHLEETAFLRDLYWAPDGRFWLSLELARPKTKLLILERDGKLVGQYLHEPSIFLTAFEFGEKGEGRFFDYSYAEYKRPLPLKVFQITPDGQELMDANSTQFFHRNGLLGYTPDSKILKHQDYYWVYSDKGTFNLLPLDGKHPVLLPEKFAPPKNITSIFPDKDGAVWVCSQFGLYRFRLQKPLFRKVLFNHNPANPDASFAFRQLTTDGQRNLWAMAENHSGLWKVDAKSGLEQQVVKFGKTNYAVCKTASGELVFQTDYMNYLDPATLQIVKKENYRFPDDNLSSWVIHEDKYGKIWFDYPEKFELRYLQDGQLNILKDWAKEGGKFQYLCYQFLEDQTDTCWLVTNGGLFRFDLKSGQVLQHYWRNGSGQFHLPYDNINFMYRAQADTFWLASASNGLLKWHPKKGIIEQFTRADGLPSNTIYAIYKDGRENFWLPTENGIVQFNPLTKNTKGYAEKDGLSHHEFNRISHCQDAAGNLYFGSLNGITAFNPTNFWGDTQRIQPPLVITGFQQFDGEQERLVDRTADLRGSNTITMKPGDRFFLLELALLTYEETENMQYAWKVEGIDKDWTYQKEKSIRFSRLPYGKHLLHIKGQASNGQWSENELSISVVALKPFYLQYWFFILIGVAVFAFFRWRIRNLKARQATLEGVVEKRTQQIFKDKQIIEQQAEELKSLEQLKSRFFANVSHELRTPLTLILGPVSSLLKHGKKTGDEHNLLQFIERNARQLQKLINEILDLSKLEDNKLELSEEPVHFFPYLKEQMAQFHSFAYNDNMKFEINYHADESLILMLDKSKFEKIVHNFLSNAMKFTPQGGKVTLGIAETEDHLEISVRDTGRGIHPDDQPHIFDRFYQSKQPDVKTEGGTGIGLSLCKELAQLFGGEVWAKSEWGKGSVFYFKFPKKVVEANLGGNLELPPKFEPTGQALVEESTVSTTSIPKSGGNFKLPPDLMPRETTILVVEDNPDLRQYLQFLLSDYHVLTAENGQDAFDCLVQTPDCQLIISDLMMPVMDGFQLLEKLKSDDRWRHLPVIMLTAKVNVLAKLEALRIGVDDYLTKPFEEEELKARIKNLLHNYRERMTYFSAIAMEEVADKKDPLMEKPVIAQVDSEWLKEVESVFSKNLSDRNYNLEWVASELSLSTRQFSRRLQKLVGLSPNHYLQEMRLQMAKDQLLNGKYATVKEIGFSVGFRDTPYFSTLFQERFGVPPSTYLRA